MQGIYTYIPERNCVPREYSVAAVLLLLFMVLISLVLVLNLLYFYIIIIIIALLPNRTVKQEQNDCQNKTLRENKYVMHTNS